MSKTPPGIGTNSTEDVEEGLTGRGETGEGIGGGVIGAGETGLGVGGGGVDTLDCPMSCMSCKMACQMPTPSPTMVKIIPIIAYFRSIEASSKDGLSATNFSLL